MPMLGLAAAYRLSPTPARATPTRSARQIFRDLIEICRCYRYEKEVGSQLSPPRTLRDFGVPISWERIAVAMGG